MRRNLLWLSDEQWGRIEPHLPTVIRRRAGGRPPRHQRHRACSEKRLSLVRLPAQYGPPTTIYNRLAGRGVASGKTCSGSLLETDDPQTHR